MTTPIRNQLAAYNRCVTGMLADPELVGDLLLIGMHWARAVHLNDPPLDGIGKATARAVYGTAHHGYGIATWNHLSKPQVSPTGTQRVWDVIRTDIRRYIPDQAKGSYCQRPIRRSKEEAERRGEICGRPSHPDSYHAWFVDPVNGHRHLIGHCNHPRCRTWWNDLHARNREELGQRPPEPTANHGGVLARHLPELDWEQIYRALDPKWVPPHEAEPWRPPTLRLVVDLDGCGEEVPSAGSRPVLSVVKGGWR